MNDFFTKDDYHCQESSLVVGHLPAMCKPLASIPRKEAREPGVGEGEEEEKKK